MSSQTNIETTIDQKVKTPRMFVVILHNDDATPMDFVVYLLRIIFRLDDEAATQVMMTVHHNEKAVAGTYSREIAEQKVKEATTLARANNHALRVSMQPE